MIFNSVINITELLRRTAEFCLRDIVQHLFVRLPQFADDTRGLLSMKVRIQLHIIDFDSTFFLCSMKLSIFQKMRANNMENAKNKPKKNKTNLKPKVKPNLDDIDDTEAQLLSPVERVKINHLATTPVTPAGNIVDMQGSLNQVTPEKIDDDKSENKSSESKSDITKDSLSTEQNSKESNLSTDSDTSKNSSVNKVSSESDSAIQSPRMEDKVAEEQTNNKVNNYASGSTDKQGKGTKDNLNNFL